MDGEGLRGWAILVQERLAADTTLSGPGGTGGSMVGGCSNVMLVVDRATRERGKPPIIRSCDLSLWSQYICLIFFLTLPHMAAYIQSHIVNYM